MDYKKVRSLAQAMKLQSEKLVPLAKELVTLMRLIQELNDEVADKPMPQGKSDYKIIEFHK